MDIPIKLEHVTHVEKNEKKKDKRLGWSQFFVTVNTNRVEGKVSKEKFEDAVKYFFETAEGLEKTISLYFNTDCFF